MSNPTTVRRLLILAHVLVLIMVLLALQFLMNLTGGTLFVFTTAGVGALGLALAILSFIAYLNFKKTHQLFDQRSILPGETVFKEGDAGDAAYFIREGEVEVVRGDSVIANLKKGDYFGEMALLSGQPRNATVRTTKTTRLAVLGKKNFLAMLKMLPSTERDILDTIQERAMQVVDH